MFVRLGWCHLSGADQYHSTQSTKVSRIQINRHPTHTVRHFREWLLNVLDFILLVPFPGKWHLFNVHRASTADDAALRLASLSSQRFWLWRGTSVWFSFETRLGAVVCLFDMAATGRCNWSNGIIINIISHFIGELYLKWAVCDVNTSECHSHRAPALSHYKTPRCSINLSRTIQWVTILGQN